MKLEQTVELGSKVGGALDDLNVALREAEQALTKLRLGVRAEIPFTDPGEKGMLGFGKYDKRWLLLYIRHINATEEEEIPLTDAPRDVRLRAVPMLKDLLTALVHVAQEQVERVEEATKKARDFAAALTASPEPKPPVMGPCSCTHAPEQHGVENGMHGCMQMTLKGTCPCGWDGKVRP